MNPNGKIKRAVPGFERYPDQVDDLGQVKDNEEASEAAVVALI